MGLDAGLFAALGTRPKSMADFQSDYNALDIQNQQKQVNALTLQTGQMGLDEKRKSAQRAQDLQGVVGGFGEDHGANALSLYQKGFLSEAQDYMKAMGAVGKDRSAAAKDDTQAKGYQLDQKIKSHDYYVQLLGSVDSPQKAAQWLEDGLKSGDLSEQAYASANASLQQASSNPQAFSSWRQMAMQGGMSVSEQLKAQLEQTKQQQTTANDVMIPNGAGGFKVNGPLLSAKQSVARAGASNISVNTGQKGYENESKLRNDFKSEPIYKDFQDVKSAHAQIKTALTQGTPIADTAAATKIMKILDPGSVVRESELGMAMAAAGKLDRIQNYVQMQVSGEKLTPQQRKDFGSLADELLDATSNAYNAKRGEYEEFGKTYELNPAVLGPAASTKGAAKAAGISKPASSGGKFLGFE